jgi:hypothetical protein
MHVGTIDKNVSNSELHVLCTYMPAASPLLTYHIVDCALNGRAATCPLVAFSMTTLSGHARLDPHVEGDP